MLSRRDSLSLITCAALLPHRAVAQGAAASSMLDPWAEMAWPRGFEGQRRADLGDGRFLNPILAGDRPDPALLRDGDDYFLTFSSFDAYPGLTIWHSRDLINWRPLTAALKSPIGSVWAPDLIKHEGRYYLFIPARTALRRSIYMISAPAIAGPWTEPVDLNLPNHIDPAHVADEHGQRWLYLSGGDRVRLNASGSATVGKVEHVYDPWRYPDDWVVESFSPEGPKLVKRGDFWYMITAVGGTAGPPTGHMVIAARSRKLNGPWEDCPRNPLIRTQHAREKWWSRGHATLFEGPNGGWWMIYHGYESGYWTLGRQCLLEPVRWSADGWPEPMGGDLSRPIAKPLDAGQQQHGMALSDDFKTDRMGLQWAFYDPSPGEVKRIRRADGLILEGKGTTPSDCSPLCCIVGDQRYRVTVDITPTQGCEAGVLLFYNRRLYAGLGLHARGMTMHRYGLQRERGRPADIGVTIRMRLTNDRNIVTLETSGNNGQTWRKFDVQMEVSGYHHNVAYDFLSLRPALYAAGGGEARFANFQYEAL